jgi:hypothetical protein
VARRIALDPTSRQRRRGALVAKGNPSNCAIQFGLSGRKMEPLSPPWGFRSMGHVTYFLRPAPRTGACSTNGLALLIVAQETRGVAAEELRNGEIGPAVVHGKPVALQLAHPENRIGISLLELCGRPAAGSAHLRSLLASKIPSHRSPSGRPDRAPRQTSPSLRARRGLTRRQPVFTPPSGIASLRPRHVSEVPDSQQASTHATPASVERLVLS